MARDGLILDRYEPLGTAGEGGFGTVQVAWDPRIQRKVAVKTIRLTALDAARAALPGAQAVSADPAFQGWQGAGPWPDNLDDPGSGPAPFVSPFREAENDLQPPEAEGAGGTGGQVTSLSHVPGLDEARTAAMLADPRIVTVYDFEVRDRFAYLIMEYVEGITLTTLLSNYADYLTLDMVATVFDAVAAALTTAHGAGVLHLDIKPDNILINAQGQVKVTDFGLATLADASGGGKTGGGTIGYMPPEQIRREKLDARADEWSLASVTYEMLTGSNPFRVPRLDAALQAIEGAELILPSLCWKNIDEQIDDVVFYALDPNRDERYASVADFAEEAEKFLGDPDRGIAQLQLVVEDALGLGDWEEADGGRLEDGSDDAYVRDDRNSRSRRTGAANRGFLDSVLARFGLASEPPRPSSPSGSSRAGASRQLPPQRTFTERFLDLVVDEGEELDAAGDGNGDLDSSDRRGSRDDGGSRRVRQPLSSRVSDRMLWVAQRLFGALGSGFITALALNNMQPISSAFGPGAIYVIIFVVLLVAVLGAIRSHLGALVSLCLLGIAFVMCGHPIVGAFVLIVAVAWWYTIGHEGAASANTVLLLPLAGAVGGATMVPFFSGASLPPVRACATTLLAFALAVIFGALGSGSVLDWAAVTHWDFVRADVSSMIVRMLSRPETWAIAAGWIASTAALSLLRLRGLKALNVIGVALALAIVLVATLLYGQPSPQLIVSAIVASAVLLALEV